MIAQMVASGSEYGRAFWRPEYAQLSACSILIVCAAIFFKGSFFSAPSPDAPAVVSSVKYMANGIIIRG